MFILLENPFPRIRKIFVDVYILHQVYINPSLRLPLLNQKNLSIAETVVNVVVPSLFLFISSMLISVSCVYSLYLTDDTTMSRGYYMGIYLVPVNNCSNCRCLPI